MVGNSTVAAEVTNFNQDVVNFAAFMRPLALPTPAPPTPKTSFGQEVFVKLGCEACHTQSFTIGPSKFDRVRAT